MQSRFRNVNSKDNIYNRQSSTGELKWLSLSVMARLCGQWKEFFSGKDDMVCRDLFVGLICFWY